MIVSHKFSLSSFNVFQTFENRPTESSQRPEMALVTVAPTGIDTILLTIASINGSLLIDILSKQLYKISKDIEPNLHCKIMHFFALFAIFTNTLFCTIQIHLSYVESNIMGHPIRLSILEFIWITGKVSLYLFVTERYVMCIPFKIRNVPR